MVVRGRRYVANIGRILCKIQASQRLFARHRRGLGGGNCPLSSDGSKLARGSNVKSYHFVVQHLLLDP